MFARSAQLDLRHTTFVSRREELWADSDRRVKGSLSSPGTWLPLHDTGGRVLVTFWQEKETVDRS